MKPILELDPERAGEPQGVVFDVDDTLSRDRRVEAPAFRALRQPQAAGSAPIGRTRRPLDFAELMARWWPIDAAVGENGAGYIRVTPYALEVGYSTDEAERASAADGEQGRRLLVGDSGNDAAAFASWTLSVAHVVDPRNRVPVAPRFGTHASRRVGFAELTATSRRLRAR